MILRPTVIKMIFILFIALFKNKKEGRKGTALDSVAHNACVVLTTDQPGLSTFSIYDTTLSNVDLCLRADIMLSENVNLKIAE